MDKIKQSVTQTRSVICTKAEEIFSTFSQENPPKGQILSETDSFVSRHINRSDLFFWSQSYWEEPVPFPPRVMTPSEQTWGYFNLITVEFSLFFSLNPLNSLSKGICHYMPPLVLDEGSLNWSNSCFSGLSVSWIQCIHWVSASFRENSNILIVITIPLSFTRRKYTDNTVATAATNNKSTTSRIQ